MTRPLPIAADTMKPYAASPWAAYSNAYFALPVTFRGPSTRSSGRPIGPARSLCAMGISLAETGLLSERGAQCPAGKRDFEIVVAISASVSERSSGGGIEGCAGRRRAHECSLGPCRSPRLVGEASECDARHPHPVAVQVEDRRDRNERERVGRAVANFAINLPTGGGRRQQHRRDQFARRQDRFDMRRVAGWTIERIDRNSAG